MKLPPANSRVCFCGPTRSGKTYLARSWLRTYNNVAVLDPKRQFTWHEHGKRFARIATTYRQFEKLMVKSEADGYPVIYRPPEEHLLPEHAEYLDGFFRYCLERRNTLAYVDELYYVASGSDFTKRAPFYFRAVTTGASKGVGVWSSFQRPTWVPLISLSETDMRAVFFLRFEADRKRIEENFGPVPWDLLRMNKYSFVLSTDEWTSGVLRLKGVTPKGKTSNGNSSGLTAIPIRGGTS